MPFCRYCRCIALAALLIVPLALLSATPGHAAASAPRVLLKTSLGDITLELNASKAPKTVANFLEYVKSGFYKGTVFHRVINGFMIQGGGHDTAMNLKSTNPAIENEADNGLKNQAYTIAMARTQDPHSATAQFFINVANNTFLDHTAKTPSGWGYTVFGRVVDGASVVDAIKAVPVKNAGYMQNVPVTQVVILDAVLLPAQ
ncbi:MAG: peptidylprolyl isomerase [Desulfovibrionaceae bacterium]